MSLVKINQLIFYFHKRSIENFSVLLLIANQIQILAFSTTFVQMSIKMFLNFYCVATYPVGIVIIFSQSVLKFSQRVQPHNINRCAIILQQLAYCEY